MRLILPILFLIFSFTGSRPASALSQADMELMETFAFIFYGAEESETNFATTRKYYDRNSVRYETIISSADFPAVKEEHRTAKFSRITMTLRVRETCVIAYKYSHVASRGNSRNQFEADTDSVEGTYYLNRITRLEAATSAAVPRLGWVELNAEGQNYHCDPKGCQSKLTAIIGFPGGDGPSYDREEILQRRQNAVGIIRKYCPGRAG